MALRLFGFQKSLYFVNANHNACCNCGFKNYVFLMLGLLVQPTKVDVNVEPLQFGSYGLFTNSTIRSTTL